MGLWIPDHLLELSSHILDPRQKPSIKPWEIDREYLLNHPQTRDCIGWWPLLEGAGNIAYDIVGGYDGTLEGASTDPAWVAESYGWGMEVLDGTADHRANMGDVLDILAADDLTVSVIFRQSADINSSFFAKRAGVNSSVGWMFLVFGDDFIFEIDDGTTETNARTTDNPLDGNREVWHAVGVLERGVSIRLFVNGILEDTQSTVATGSLANAIDLRLGGDSGYAFFQGFIYDARMWRRALTDAEVEDLCRNPWASIRPIFKGVQSAPVAAPVSGVGAALYHHFRNLGVYS